jgi:hypothetical protein
MARTSPHNPGELPVKPFSEACERNKGPILNVLHAAFAERRRVLEIGSGSGQHAVHFAAHLPHLLWQPSDVPEHLSGIEAWRAQADLPNLLPALALDVDQPAWPETGADAVFTANTLHILSWPQVCTMVERVGKLLGAGGVLAIYGPFNYDGRHTSESNARFDVMLRARDPNSGIRDFEAVDALVAGRGFSLVRDAAMPANNRTVVWAKTP